MAGLVSGFGKGLKRVTKRVRVAKRAAGRGAKRLGKSGFAKAAGESVLSGLFSMIGGGDLAEIRKQEAEKKAASAAAGGGGGSTGGGATLPGLDTPETAAKVSNPTLASLIDQVDQLVAIAGRISDNLKAQQEQFVNQNAQAVRVDKEAKLEKAQDAVPEAPTGSGSDIGPVSSAIDGFAAALTALTEAIQNGAGGGGGSLLDMLDGGKKSKAAKAAKAGKAAGITKEVTKTGKTVLRDAKTGRFVSKNAGEAAKLAKQPGMLRRGLGAVSGSKGVKALTGAIAGGAAAAGKTGLGKGVKSVVKKLAKPLIAKGLGKATLKSIPLAGAAVGGLFAIGRLLQGDWVGAGIEAASGLAGPFTAVPALIASIARDIYQGVYGIQPEVDPEFKSRFPEVMSGVKEVAGEVMAPQIEKKGSATGKKNEIPQQSVPAVSASPTSGSAPAVPKAANPESAPAPAGSGAAIGAPTNGGSSAPDAAPVAMAGGAGGITGSSSTESKPAPSLPVQPEKQQTAMAKPIEPAATSGNALETATANAIPPQPNINDGSMPARVNERSNMPTSRAGYRGQGNVPDPNYNGDDAFISQLLFLG